jgi:transcriptional regulator with XRE-family HTH domain
MFATNLKEFRLKLNMSQRELASELDITQQGYCRWENGQSFPNEEKLVRLCQILRCTPNDLLGIKEKYFDAMNKLDQ